ncbi:WXG100 family type VII secretion target [Amycolatopsis sp. FBCC-B4732]|uniref:WXG100 family type VII secretion target n=1 Tax=Amycolatopsis sp. FBCC-B4732 TaxID=3079339 RepID=UPI001FF5E6B7|nr:WXG100 family type VII secretion target [Amycolatopsis sp. FBCC-B4732]UOX85116.1 WXG100 family type VII secretion target [Amycolatopsis sp. FBCC-B4732]
MTKNTAHTNFAAYSHQQLYAMLQAGDPNSARHAADKWKSAALHLHEQSHNLNSELAEFKDQWTGGAADQYQHMIVDLANGIAKVAQTAEAMNVMLGDAADALVKAKKEMPPPVSVPDVSPADVALAVNPPLLPPDASPAVVQAAAQQRQQAISNVEAQQSAANAAGSAHGKAIVVMTELAGEYSVAEESIPASPNAVQTPTAPPAGGGGAGSAGSPGLVGNGVTDPGVVVTPGDGHPLPSTGTPQPGTTVPTSNPLFGDMFTAGLAAASAAAFGRFGSIMPKVPSWATGKDPKDNKDEAPGTKLGGGGAGVEGGAGGGIPIGGGDAPSIGGGIPGGAGIGGGGADAPAAHSGLAGDGGTGNALSGLAGGAAGAVGAAAAKSAMPMMPMMPMGMGGGGDMGSGRRIPAWLVETENVWGQSAPVAPPVIGEEPEAY